MTKQHIVNEIRRTATANGGIPLGRQRFFTETGIKTSDWHGKYWARWSDAVREAGLEPNQKTLAYADDLLMEKFISLARELGRLPVSGDLRLKARNDSRFPSCLSPKGEDVLQDRKKQRIGLPGARACHSTPGKSEHRTCDSHR